jgi:Collagen triple helix repeat (20 copies)
MATNGEPENPAKSALMAGAELIKYITALGTGAIVFSAGLITQKIVITTFAKWLLGAAWIILAFSVLAGLLAAARIPINLAEKNYDWEKDKLLKYPAAIQQLLFLLGIFTLGLALVLMLANHRITPDPPANPCCPPGERGQQGLAGPTGEHGSQGERGPEGTMGSQGPTGPQGSLGLRGLTGSQGPPGPQGPVGVPGPPGLQGRQGISGVINEISKASTEKKSISILNTSPTGYITIPDMIITNLSVESAAKALILGHITVQQLEGPNSSASFRMMIDGAPSTVWQDSIRVNDAGPGTDNIVSVPVIYLVALNPGQHIIEIQIGVQKGLSAKYDIYSRNLNLFLF